MKFYLIQNGKNRFITDNSGFKQINGEGWYVVDVTLAPCYQSAIHQFANS
ncbi:hypothetical protein [Vibrio mediterranei]